MKTYRGLISDDSEQNITVVTESGSYKLPLRLDLANHSPTGFAWGYNGSGPAQLALAILADLYDDTSAKIYYTYFKEYEIMDNEKHPQDKDFELEEKVIHKWLKALRRF